MKGARFGPGTLVVCVALLVAAWVAPAHAQSGVRGKVVDAKNQPVEEAVITIERIDGASRKLETKTNKRGEFVQVGLQPGVYRITAAKGEFSQAFEQRIRFDLAEVNFVLKPGSATVTDADRKKAEAKAAALKGAFEEGVALSNEGKYDEAIAKFNEVLADVPKCAECLTNIGAVYTRKKEYDQAEAAYKKALEVNPDSADVYNGLATVYNAQRKFDQAAEASAQAQKLAGAAGGSAGGDAGTVFNQGVIAWNAGKVPEAKKLFEQAVKLDPTLADAQYWLGMAMLNEGKIAEAVPLFEEYLKLAPDGQYAEQAKSIVKSIKK
ncbi:MAG TPA: tetratricopeptide repeat protein [Vicinamibacterales bacterium]|nr:tetratricopeptide repeat protein [Vicinamibacterales bacterium]